MIDKHHSAPRFASCVRSSPESESETDVEQGSGSDEGEITDRPGRACSIEYIEETAWPRMCEEQGHDLVNAQRRSGGKYSFGRPGQGWRSNDRGCSD